MDRGSSLEGLSVIFPTEAQYGADLSLAVERFSSAQVKPASDPHYDVAGVLMNLNNSSYQSFGKPQARAVDVSDLREALGEYPLGEQHCKPYCVAGGRGDSIPSSPPSIVSTGGARSFADEAPRKKSPNPDVKEILREIFQDKKRGGTIKRSKTNGEGKRNGGMKANGEIKPNGEIKAIVDLKANGASKTNLAPALAAVA